MQKFDDFISLSGDYESRMCPSLCVCHNENTKVKIFDILPIFKEIVESDTFFGRLGESWLEESLKEKVAGDLWYFLSYSLLFSKSHRYTDKNKIDRSTAEDALKSALKLNFTFKIHRAQVGTAHRKG